ncbi:coadhesin-like isoform X2, partial [Paramuricea clavata]
TCLPAEAEPTLNSSSCYPLVNFTLPACENVGITLPNYVYQTPDFQNNRNDRANMDYDTWDVKIGASKISRFLKVDISTVRKCGQAFAILYCHLYFPSCDRTQSVFKEQKICHESCLHLTRMCGELWEMFVKSYTIRHPKAEETKLLRCELQPTRNAGDSPECWYFSGDTKSTDAFPAPELATNADCLFLNGSSYHGNISVTASGIPCQSWTEQCLHRHTMNETYPELNNAQNYCRNPKNSGQRPWCFTTDRNKRWEYCDIPRCIPVDGSYGNWSLNITCNVTCGEGFGTWTRECNNPQPKYGGINCSHLGEHVQYRPCSAKPCPVNGDYSNWTLSISCNVSCGDGVEIWRRFCNRPEPKYGGENCRELGSSSEFRNCTQKPCPIDGNYGNWTTSPCSATCGQGVEIRARQCDNPSGKYGGNCSKQGPPQQIRSCEIKPCPVHFDSQMIGITVVAVVSVIILTVACLILILRRRRRKAGPTYYASSLDILPPRSHCLEQLEGNNISAEYQNQTSEGEPAPGFSRGVVRYRKDYMNTGPARHSWYDRLQLIRPLATEWFQNAWGNVDEFGRHVYDVMQRVRHVFVPYNKLGNLLQGDLVGSGVGRSNNTYRTMERPAAVILPNESGNESTIENV